MIQSMSVISGMLFFILTKVGIVQLKMLVYLIDHYSVLTFRFSFWSYISRTPPPPPETNKEGVNFALPQYLRASIPHCLICNYEVAHFYH